MPEPAMPEPTVIARRDGRIGRLVLNRPKALNALDLDAIRALRAALEQWRTDPAVEAVVIEGSGGRAFSAGADVRAVRAAVLAGDHAAVETFFAEEYALDAAIAAYPKPYVALVDGICMGGGIGLAVHGAVRITTEAGLFAMPETAIALFPDVGATFLLPRLPGEIGMYMALTGARLAGADAVHAGLATHFVPRANFACLAAALATEGVAAVAAAATALPPFTLAPHRAAIDRCFAAASVAEVRTRLAVEATPWAEATLATLGAMSPSALAWSFAAVRRGAGLDLGAALAAELRLTRTVTRHPDFAEGVRAMVVDKDKTPRWTPTTIEAVDPAAIAAMLGG
jgi:enoyl-CoA hydratase